ncbi:MAG TPA: hypothetical protein VNN10_06640 [Dehalococcoidia bacterium]|nr:hypothetical protein [Dehalococcoidia bacterium]
MIVVIVVLFFSVFPEEALPCGAHGRRLGCLSVRTPRTDDDERWDEGKHSAGEE